MYPKQEHEDIFLLKDQEDCMEDPPELSEEKKMILKKANLLARSVPRQTNRTKWRERSGFGPNMLVEQFVTGKLFKGDLVCCRSTNKLDYLIVQEETVLDSNDVQIVLKRASDEEVVLSIRSLVVEKGHIMALPSSLYKISGGEVHFSTSAARSFEKILNEQLEKADEDVAMTDDDWAILVEDY